MSILQIGGPSRDNSAKKLEKLLASLERERAREVSDKVQEGGRTIGERHETITSALEEASSALSCLRGVEASLDRARKSLSQEFETRRADRAEIVALSALLEQTGQDLSGAWSRETDLQGRLTLAESAVAELRAQKLDVETLAAARLADVGRLNGEGQAARGELSELRNGLEQANGRVQRLDEDNGRLRAKLDELELRRQDSEKEAAAASQAHGLAVAEQGVLERRSEALTAEVSRAARTVADLEAQLAAEKARARGLETGTQAAQAELDRLNRSIEERAEKARGEVETAELRLQTAQARAARLEEENTALLERVTDASARDRAAERDAGELKLRLERAEEQVERLATDLTASRQERASVEHARTAAVERGDRMAELAQSREAEIQRLDEQVDVLQGRVTALDAQIAQDRVTTEERLKSMSATVERERSERSIVVGALEAARKGRARLHLEMLKVNRGRPVSLDGALEDAPEAANAEA